MAGIIFVAEGGVQTLAGPATIHNGLNGVTQTIARGPIAFMEAIKQLGTNGGGFLNANSATTFENPTGLTNWLSIFLLLSIPFALTYTFGKMVGSIRHGAALLAAMVLIFGTWVGYTSLCRAPAEPGRAGRGRRPDHRQHGGQRGPLRRHQHGVVRRRLHEHLDRLGRRVLRFLHARSAVFGLMSGMMLGEVTPGGTGSGMYTILIYAIIAVFIGGLMIGRTPEYLGKKIQAKEVKLAGFGALVMPIIVLVIAGIAVSIHGRESGTAERRAARLQRDPLRLDVPGEQQRLRVRGPHRQHGLLQHRRAPSTC